MVIINYNILKSILFRGGESVPKIIIIEDTDTIREELKTFLTIYGYDVAAPANFENIIDYTLRETPDLILLDINLPIFDGYHICREIRKSSNVPIIVVTSRDSEMDELMSMNLGADDFITKPYNTQILLARISSILRRVHGSNAQDIISYNDLKLSLSNATITYKGNTAELTKNELKILSCLIKNKGTIVSRDDLMDFMWNSDIFVDDNNLSVNVTRLRKKLEEVGMKENIETKRGLGYILP
jgi:DNA-binding response OmpR family regulator